MAMMLRTCKQELESLGDELATNDAKDVEYDRAILIATSSLLSKQQVACLR
ncbi:hypothetical protein KC19_1G207500 [Ceratodon purpureus]|uniref:Uncharacterized protein n=1 Tax=Ceratodon purpureus TaxID=3225 RepID=A0A8T0J878_CERPU|nr:hypothetical protein KC19_1G207500 [Ceratodon purpureus]